MFGKCWILKNGNKIISIFSYIIKFYLLKNIFYKYWNTEIYKYKYRYLHKYIIYKYRNLYLYISIYKICIYCIYDIYTYTYLPYIYIYHICTWVSLVAQMVKNSPAVRMIWVWSLGWEDLLEKGMGTSSSILAWRFPMDSGAVWATVPGVTKSQTQLSD